MTETSRKSYRVYLIAAVLGAVLSIAGNPLLAQTVSLRQSTGCEETVSHMTQGEPTLQARLDAPLMFGGSKYVAESAAQSLTGRLACADPRPAFYNCGHTKQSIWGCKPDCIVEPDGWQYVLQTAGKTYLVTGDPDQIRPFLADRVTVTGQLKGDTIRALSISKVSQRQGRESLTSETERH